MAGRTVLDRVIEVRVFGPLPTLESTGVPYGSEKHSQKQKHLAPFPWGAVGLRIAKSGNQQLGRFMSDENESNETGETGKGLRAQLEKALADLQAEKAVADQFRTSQRTETVKGILKAKGVPESAARLYTGDDVSDDAVGKWIDEYKDVFTGAPAGQQAGGAGTVDPNAAAAQRVSDASYGNAQTPQAAGDNKILGAPEEILRALQTLPMDDLIKMGYMPKPGTIFNPRR